ncbi:MAG: hypothetical protein QNK37_26115 [Acidobacteriota bacterium]|nr:hypothetical protein [Acidobacteriota bacterium]
MPVFHLDIEAFLTAAERIRDPALQRAPLVVALPRARSSVIAASPDAKQLGIVRDMPLERVQRDFPGVRVVPPDHRLYDRANTAVLEIVHDFCPLVEPVGYGHVAMDMTGMRKLYGSLEDAARLLCKQLKQQTRLSATVGIAANKLVSTIAAKEVQKNNEILYLVPDDQEVRFLAPLACRALPEWNDRTVRRLLFELNLRRISQIQAIPRDIFSFALGKPGTNLHRHAMGIDPQPVTPPDQTPRLVETHRFIPDTNDDRVLQATVYRLVEKLCFSMRAKEVTARFAVMHMIYSDDVHRRRSFRFIACNEEQPLYRTLMAGYRRLCDRRRRVRSISITVQELVSTREAQLLLFDKSKPNRLAPKLDAIRQRFGRDAVQVGRALKAG